MAAARVSRWWAGLDPRHRRWLFVNALVITAVINFGVSGALGWLNGLGSEHVRVWSIPLFERTSVFTDAIGTFFILPLVTSVLCTIAVRAEQRKGALPLVDPPAQRVTARLPRSILLRGLLFGAVLTTVLTPPTALVLSFARIGEMSRLGFALYAALIAVVLGSFVTPVVAVLAMSERPNFGGFEVAANAETSISGP